MHRLYLTAAARRCLSWLVFVLAGTVVFAPKGALAADARVEKEVQALEKKAIEEDFLNVNYTGAIKKIQTGIAKCGGDKCSSAVKAALIRDLGAMQILNGSVDEGKASFAQAIGMDSSIELDPAYKNPQLEGVWTEVKKKGGAGAAPLKAGPQPTGDFVHTPPAEALVRTPLPVYVEYSGTESLARVTVKFKAFGMPDWKTIELKKSEGGFGALIPCKDVTQGLMQYYVQGFSDKSDPVATSGTRNKPFTVPVNAQISGPAPSLPGEEPPQQCADTGECPPDFPGCGSKKKAGGEDCQKDADCESSTCSDGKCVEKKASGEDCGSDSECNSGTCSGGKCAGKKPEGEACEADEDCDSGRCTEAKCSAATGSKGKWSKVWVGLGVQLDEYLLPGASDACVFNAASNNPYSCADQSSGAAFPYSGYPLFQLSPANLNAGIVRGARDQVLGGPRVGNVRLFLSLDYALSGNTLLGLRAGYVFRTDPASPPFAPLHLEGRFTYLFGQNAVAKKGLSPMLFAGLGAGEFDAYVPVTVYLQPKVGPQAGNLLSNTYNAWLTAGPFFFSAGGGVRYLVAPKAALTAALKFEGAFGGGAGFLPGLAPEVGAQLGF